MILGVGIDLVRTERIEKLLIKFDKKFENKIFTDNEIIIAEKLGKNINDNNSKIKYYAKRFAAKEALSKAVGTGIGRGINFLDIEIINDKNGKPEIKLSKKAESFILEHFQISFFTINLSLADEENIAQAIVILSKKN